MTKKLALLFGVSMIPAAGLGYAASHGHHGMMSGSGHMNWQPLGEGPLQVTVLWGDPATGEHGRLIKLPAGFSAPVHMHSGDYHGINLAGTWRHSFEDGESVSKDLPPGSHVFQPATLAKLTGG